MVTNIAITAITHCKSPRVQVLIFISSQILSRTPWSREASSYVLDKDATLRGRKLLLQSEWPQRLHSPKLNLPPILSRNMGFLLFPIRITRCPFSFQILAAIHPSAGMCQDHSLELHPLLKNSRNFSLCLKLYAISPRAHLLHVQLEFLGKQDTQMPENSFSNSWG